jgi:hypothetical protein
MYINVLGLLAFFKSDQNVLFCLVQNFMFEF